MTNHLALKASSPKGKTNSRGHKPHLRQAFHAAYRGQQKWERLHIKREESTSPPSQTNGGQRPGRPAPRAGALGTRPGWWGRARVAVLGTPSSQGGEDREERPGCFLVTERRPPGSLHGPRTRLCSATGGGTPDQDSLKHTSTPNRIKRRRKIKSCIRSPWESIGN